MPLRLQKLIRKGSVKDSSILWSLFHSFKNGYQKGKNEWLIAFSFIMQTLELKYKASLFFTVKKG